MSVSNLFRVIPLKAHGLSLLILLFIIPVANRIEAQTFINKACNGMRPGDCLVKQQIEYKEPGPAGENVWWDFSKQQTINDRYRLNYYGVADSLIVGEEHGTLYKYLVEGDSLLLAGIENPTTQIDNRKPELLLVYPVSYGDKREDYFHGNGDYGNQLFITARGKVSVQADACGTLLLPTGDTLRNVLRVRHFKTISGQTVPYPFVQPGDTVFSPDSIDCRLAADTLLMQVETYRWYAQGWRYPVFETTSNRMVNRGKPQEYSRSSFYYCPVDQYYDLANDPSNQAVRDKNQEQEHQSGNTDRKELSGNSGETPLGKIISFETNLADGNNTLNLSYSLNEDAEVTIMLFDVQGRQLSVLQEGKQQAGLYQETLSLYGLDPGEYTLRIVVNNQVFGEKIVK